MKPSGTLCQRLGIRQQDMAQYLGVSTHLMALCETNRRNLPVAACMKLLKLELLLQQKNRPSKKAASLPHAKDHAEKTGKLLKQHAADCAFKAARADRKLADMQEKCEKAQAFIQLLELLDEELPEEGPDKIWVDIMRRVAHEKLEQNGSHAQTKLKLRIIGFRQQEAAAKEILGEG
jgi:hypothetical protein